MTEEYVEDCLKKQDPFEPTEIEIDQEIDEMDEEYVQDRLKKEEMHLKSKWGQLVIYTLREEIRDKLYNIKKSQSLAQKKLKKKVTFNLKKNQIKLI